ncbi:MAG TPA: hypothetical protein VGR54_04730 [Nitrosopumilaceae archaeon]|nr:hypothetical protein [Nitrosopumilaceae archaeon]
MLNEEDLINRMIQVKKLREECYKHLESTQNTLTHKIIFTIAKLSSEKMGPVKLAEIAQAIFEINDKSKQDIIRLTMEKTLLKCGMVEKLHYAANDVRYILTGYRFQKVKKIESFRGDSSEPVGEVFEIPRSSWPIPDEFFILRSKKSGYEEALKKLNSDYDANKVQRGKYEDLIRKLAGNLSEITKKTNAKFANLDETMDE